MNENGQTIMLMQQIAQQQQSHTQMINEVGKINADMANQVNNLIGLTMLHHCMQTALLDSIDLYDPAIRESIEERYVSLCKDYKLNPYPQVQDNESDNGRERGSNDLSIKTGLIRLLLLEMLITVLQVITL